jgi:hypothetical protein
MEVAGPNGQRWNDVEVASTFRSRLRGLIGRDAHPLLIRTCTVHGFWLRAPIRIVGIGRDGIVVGVRLLGRRRVAWLRRARWILELPAELDWPREGARLTFLAGGGESDIHAGPSVSLRHSDRQPR